MKKEIRYCDVCGEEVVDQRGLEPFEEVRSKNFVQIVFKYHGREDHLVEADLCDADRLRVLEAAVEQMKELA
jgi:hypothetical protein